MKVLRDSDKALAVIPVVLWMIGCACLARAQETRGDRQRRYENRRAEIENAYAKFADRSLAAPDRAAAVTGIGSFVTPEQNQGAARIFRDSSEQPEIRTQAIRRVRNVDSDPALVTDVLNVLADRGAPKELRRACADVIQGLLISSPTLKQRRADVQTTFRGLAEDPDTELSERAFSILIGNGDDFATQKLIEGLKTPEKATFSPAKSVRLLSLNPHGDHRQVFMDLIQRPPDRATELELIRGLAGYAPARDTLMVRGRDVAASSEVRTAALQAMLATDKAAFIKLGQDVVEQDQAPDELKIRAIEGIGFARQVPGVKYDIEAVDGALKKALDSRAPAVRRSAWNSLKQFDPKFRSYATERADRESNTELKEIFRSQLREPETKPNEQPQTRPTRR